jgi:opacity protein-like surface antigen
MKTLPLLLITTLTFISINATAETQPFDLDIGIAHKAYSIEIPSRNANNSNDTTSNVSAFGLSVEEELTEYFSLQFEIAKGYKTDESNSLFISDGVITAESYETQLDYSVSIMGKIRPLGIKTLSPVLLIGATTTSISYDYQKIVGTTIESDITKTETSSSIQYGFGLEFRAADDLNLSISYVDLSKLKLKSSVINLEAVIKF